MNKSKKQVYFLFWFDRFRALRQTVLRESCVADQSCRNFLFPWNSRHLMTDLTINFACELRDEFHPCTIENRMVVGRGYFSHDTSHSENVASARRVVPFKSTKKYWLMIIF